MSFWLWKFFLTSMLLLPFSVGGSQLYGQTDEAGITGRFRLTTIARIGTDIYYQHNGDYVKCQPRMSRLSEAYSFSLDAEANRQLRFYRRQVVVNSEGDEVERYLPVGAARVPGSGAFIFMLNPVYAEEQSQGSRFDIESLRVGVLPDELHNSAPGEWYLVNLTALPIAARLGQESEPVRIDSRARKIVSVSPTKAYDLMQFVAPIDGEPVMFYSDAWVVSEESRYLIIFTQDSGEDEISVIRMVSPSSSSEDTGERP